MDMNEFLGMDVVDTEGRSVGKIDTVEFDDITGKINYIIIKLDKGIFSREKETVFYEKIDKIKDVVLLNKKIDMDK